MPADWESAFVATCVALGLDRDDALACLTPSGAVRAAMLARSLGAKERASRAKALAATLGAVALDLEKGKLT